MNINSVIEDSVNTALRKTSQFLMPVHLKDYEMYKDGYNIYPVHSLGSGKIYHGFEGLADYIIKKRIVVIDGYAGVFWEKIEAGLESCFNDLGVEVKWIKTKSFFKPAEEITRLTSPFLGDPASVWGTKTTLSLSDLFSEDLRKCKPQHDPAINILIGPGAALANWDASVVYIDLPKNELQFRMRAGSITNLGLDKADEPFEMYKHFYFVDWVMLNAHKKSLLNRIDIIADGQWPDKINWAYKHVLEEGLESISKSVIRVRPWFEPGAWGGQWIKNHIKNINTDVVNYAWSFELIVPENGVVFESDGFLLEVSFDTLMFAQGRNVLGKFSERFGDEFPIRFDFLDTYDGGNLSIQCHPRLKYIRDNFGENITQDETYYILDCNDQAQVYLGFQEDIQPEVFKETLENSQANNEVVDIEKFVQCHEAEKHDLFLIPNGTVHSAGAGNLVLEISATPYIFTFKMYDWLRLDLDGNPRPINIEHAFNNLDFSRKGQKVRRELISAPHVLEETDGYRLIHLPTHAEHFYDVHRIEFNKEVEIQTGDGCHVLMLVEGDAMQVESGGRSTSFAYAETVVIPAAAGSYKLINKGKERIKVIKAFLK